MGLGMPEVILILVIALIVFGPRKLPELGKSLGQAMSQFRRASEDFKRTWEQEVDLEKTKTLPNPAASGSANPDASGYSSDFYSYGYEPEYGGADPASAPADPAPTTVEQTASSTVVATPTTVTAATTGDQKTEITDAKQHWI